jgi:outer membrane protein assembly factor BamD (BamD/ComL family)
VERAPLETEPASLETEPASLEAELAYLRRARNAIRQGASLSALDELDRYRRRFPAGRLEPEAEALAIEAEFAAGRSGEARARADAFLRTHSDSPQALRIRLIRDRLEAP